jgi:hypothetical protein
MAYLTLTNYDGTEAQIANVNTYVTTQMAAGNTDGIKTQVTVTDQNWNLIQRNWKDSASATAFIAYVNSLGATVNYAVVVNPL